MAPFQLPVQQACADKPVATCQKGSNLASFDIFLFVGCVFLLFIVSSSHQALQADSNRGFPTRYRSEVKELVA